MTRTVAYVVLILLAFMFASTAPAWQVRMHVRGNAITKLAEYLSGPDSRSPAAPVPIVWGREIYTLACASCHGSVNGSGSRSMRSPNEYAPRDIHEIITWGKTRSIPDSFSYSGKPIELAKNHPVFPVKLTDTERWAVAIYVNSKALDPGAEFENPEWLDSWRAKLNEPDSDGSGAGLYQSLCASCHGNLGYGNGPLANDLIPRPADLRDTAWLANQSDLFLFTTIRDGKYFPTLETVMDEDQWDTHTWSGMTGWGEYLDEDSIHSLINYMRSFGYSLESHPMRPEISSMRLRRMISEDDDSEAGVEGIVPDWNQWTWTEVRSRLPGAPREQPEWF